MIVLCMAYDRVLSFSRFSFKQYPGFNIERYCTVYREKHELTQSIQSFVWMWELPVCLVETLELSKSQRVALEWASQSKWPQQFQVLIVFSTNLVAHDTQLHEFICHLRYHTSKETWHWSQVVCEFGQSIPRTDHPSNFEEWNYQKG